MRILLITLLISTLLLGCSTTNRWDKSSHRQFPPGTQVVVLPEVQGVNRDVIKNITPVIQNAITQGYYPGAIVLATHHGHIIYQGVLGNQSLQPTIQAMRLNTVFDMASLTKVVATTPAILQLVEQGRLKLDAPVAHYWPAFAAHGKSHVTVRQLLTHTSGLQADLPDTTTETTPFQPSYQAHKLTSGERDILKQITALKLQGKPGTLYIYSDINFIVLSHLVYRMTGDHLDAYAQKHIFNPLKMYHTTFLPQSEWRNTIAPTEIIYHRLRLGVVHDHTAYTMGGVSGHAGLFSNVSDLNQYVQCLLNQGRIPRTNQFILKPQTVLGMETPEVSVNTHTARALGWEVDRMMTQERMITSFGHTGWTGTSLWIDPKTQTAVIILTSRTHPTPSRYNQLIEDRRTIASLVAASIAPSTHKVLS